MVQMVFFSNSPECNALRNGPEQEHSERVQTLKHVGGQELYNCPECK